MSSLYIYVIAKLRRGVSKTEMSARFTYLDIKAAVKRDKVTGNNVEDGNDLRVKLPIKVFISVTHQIL